MKKIRTLALTRSFHSIKKMKENLKSKKQNYENNFLDKIEIIRLIFTKNGQHSDVWNRKMFYYIGTIFDEISENRRFEIVLYRSPTYLDYICHTMLAALILSKEMDCCIGLEKLDTTELFSIIEKTANEIGLKVHYSIVGKEFRGKPYQERYVHFELK